MYDGGRHFASLANQLYRARDDLRTAQLQLQRTRSKKKAYKRGLAGRTRALQTAYTNLNRIQRSLTDAQQTIQNAEHKQRETRTILLISKTWDTIPEHGEIDNKIFQARHTFNIHGGHRGTKIKWIRAEYCLWGKFAAIPRQYGTEDIGGNIKLWVTLEHKWDDRQYQAHRREDWVSVAQVFADNQLQQEAGIWGFRVAQIT